MRTLRYMDTLFYTDAPSTYAVRIWRDTQEQISTALILYYELETHQGRDASGAKFYNWITIDAKDLCSLFLSPKGTEWPLLPALFDAVLCLHAVRSEQTLFNNCCNGAALPTFMTKQEPTLMRD